MIARKTIILTTGINSDRRIEFEVEATMADIQALDIPADFSPEGEITFCHPLSELVTETMNGISGNKSDSPFTESDGVTGD